MMLNSKYDDMTNKEILERLPVTIEIYVESLAEQQAYVTNMFDWLYEELGAESLDTWVLTFSRIKTAVGYTKIITVFVKDEETAVLFKTSCV